MVEHSAVILFVTSKADYCIDIGIILIFCQLRDIVLPYAKNLSGKNSFCVCSHGLSNGLSR